MHCHCSGVSRKRLISSHSKVGDILWTLRWWIWQYPLWVMNIRSRFSNMSSQNKDRAFMHTRRAVVVLATTLSWNCESSVDHSKMSLAIQVKSVITYCNPFAGGLWTIVEYSLSQLKFILKVLDNRWSFSVRQILVSCKTNLTALPPFHLARL